MEVEEALAIYWLQIQKRKEEKKQNRMYWIHPILTDRSKKDCLSPFMPICEQILINFSCLLELVYLLLMNLC